MVVFENIEVKDVVVPIIAAIIAALITAVFGILSDQHYFQAYPNYQVYVQSEINSEMKSEQLFLQNIGIVQAKHANVIVTSSGPLSFGGANCFEGNIENKTTDIIKMKFERISTNILCIVDFQSQINKEINSVTIVSDDAPGRIFYPQKSEQVSANITKSNFISYQSIADNSNLLGTMAIILEVTAISISVIYRYSKKKGFINKQRKLESVIKNEVEKLDEELSYYTKLTHTNAKVSTQIQNRVGWLQEQIVSKQRETDEIESKIFTSRKYDHLIEQFFIDWRTLEQYLFEITRMTKTNVDGMPTLMNMMLALKNNKIFTNEIIDTFNIINEFRNNLVHGEMKYDTKLLKQINENVRTFIQILQNMEKGD